MAKRYIIFLTILILVIFSTTLVVLSQITPNTKDTAIVKQIKAEPQAYSEMTSTPIPSAKNRIPRPLTALKESEYGIATDGNLIYYDQNQLNNYFDQLKALGTKWVRWDIDWNHVQPSEDIYNWIGIDRVANTAKKYGINSLGVITYAPEWAGSKPCQYPGCFPSDPMTYGQFAGLVAKRYKDTISHFEVWNEPNYTLFWSVPNPEIYANILKEAYINIKSNNPDALVISGGLAVVGEKDAKSIPQVQFIESLYKNNANEFFDALAIHPYTYPASPFYIASWNHWQKISEIRDIMVKNGDSTKEIWITEYGAPTGGQGEKHQSNELSGFDHGYDFMDEYSQVKFLIEVRQYYTVNSSFLGPFFWYSLQDSNKDINNPESFFGLLRNDGSKKPAFDLYSSMQK